MAKRPYKEADSSLKEHERPVQTATGTERGTGGTAPPSTRDMSRRGRERPAAGVSKSKSQ